MGLATLCKPMGIKKERLVAAVGNLLEMRGEQK